MGNYTVSRLHLQKLHYTTHMIIAQGCFWDNLNTKLLQNVLSMTLTNSKHAIHKNSFYKYTFVYNVSTSSTCVLHIILHLSLGHSQRNHQIKQNKMRNRQKETRLQCKPYNLTIVHLRTRKKWHCPDWDTDACFLEVTLILYTLNERCQYWQETKVHISHQAVIFTASPSTLRDFR